MSLVQSAAICSSSLCLCLSLPAGSPSVCTRVCGFSSPGNSPVYDTLAQFRHKHTHRGAQEADLPGSGAAAGIAAAAATRARRVSVSVNSMMDD